MSAISSINFKKSNAIQTRHNDRDLPPNYLISDTGCEVNRTHKEALKLRNEIIENSINAYNEKKSPKAPKFKATSYEWSAVCNIKPDTTMQDLENLAKHFEKKYRFQCYQIAIHRDEGYIDDDGKEVINHHAHLEFITLDKHTGKNMYRRELISPKILREIQTEVAEILKMERGQDKRISKRERVEPRKYAQMKEAERKKTKKLKTRLENLEEENKDLNRENNDFYYKNIDLEDVIQAKNQEIQELKTKNQELEAELEQEKLSKNQLEKLIKEERKAMIQKNKELEEANQQKIYNADDYKKLRELKEKQDITIAELNAEIEKIKQEAQERESKIKEIFYDEIDKMEAEIKEKNEVIQTQNQQIETLKAENERWNELLKANPALKKAYDYALEALKNKNKPKTNLNKMSKTMQDQTHNESESDDLGIDKIFKKVDKTEVKEQDQEQKNEVIQTQNPENTQTPNNEELTENNGKQATYFLNNFFKDDVSIFSKTNTDKTEISEQYQEEDQEQEKKSKKSRKNK